MEEGKGVRKCGEMVCICCSDGTSDLCTTDWASTGNTTEV